ncbi:MAG: PLAT/LH2 domain-containing protein [Bacillota bacterium]
MFNRCTLILIIALILSFTLAPVNVSAWRAAAHYSLMVQVTEALPASNVFRIAMETYPDIAAWGAYGPDIPYSTDSNIWLVTDFRYGDKTHYDRIGSTAAQLLFEAKLSGSWEQMAFAAGYATHVFGDMDCHGKFVNPDAGVYMDGGNDELHKELEIAAERYIWGNYSGLSIHEWDDHLDNYFSSSNTRREEYMAIPFINANLKVFSFWENLYVLGVSDYIDCMENTEISWDTKIGYTYYTEEEMNKVLTKERKARADEAFISGRDRAVAALIAAADGNFSHFKDTFNLDVANPADTPNKRIGTITVQITTCDAADSGTNNDIYFGIEFKDGYQYQKLLDHEGYDDFENSDKDRYYIYFPYDNYTVADISKVYLRSRDDTTFSDDWFVYSMTVDICETLSSGFTRTCTYSKTIDEWMDDNDSIWLNPTWSYLYNPMSSNTEGWRVYDDRDSSIVYRNMWAPSSPHYWNMNDSAGREYYGSSMHYTSNAGSSAKLSWQGTGVQLYTDCGPNRGCAFIYIDGEYVKTVDCYAPTLTKNVCVYIVLDLPYKTHTIELVNSGKTNSSGRIIALDRILVQ